MTDLDTLSASRYVSLTTIKRDGTPVATPVWVAGDDQRLYAITPVDTGKTKRLRHTSRVVVAPCDVRGVVSGAEVEGTARLLDGSGTEKVSRLIDEKYGLMSKAMGWLDMAVRNRGKTRERVGIEITLPTDG